MRPLRKAADLGKTGLRYLAQSVIPAQAGIYRKSKSAYAVGDNLPPAARAQELLSLPPLNAIPWATLHRPFRASENYKC
jgi:hypothetical protein